MTNLDVGQSDESNMKTALADVSVATQSTDGVQDLEETRWENEDWVQWFGHYNKIPELGIVIDAKATWTVGKGFKADEETTMLLDTFKGIGFDTFNTILENMIRTYHIGGDAYAEKVFDEEDNLINLKPLDPEKMIHISNKQGQLVKFEHKSNVDGQKNQEFTADEIFYLPRNRVADQMHGTSMTERLVEIIEAKNEFMKDWRRVLHRNVDPMLLIKLDTDNTTKIANIKAKIDKARGTDKENMYIPMGTVEIENITTAPNASLSPLATIEMYNNLFYQAAGVPQIVVGGAGALTERAVSIAYLAFQQTIEEEQLFIEEQVLSQLNLVIDLEFPASLQNDLLSDQQKDGPVNVDPSETTAKEEQAQ